MAGIHSRTLKSSDWPSKPLCSHLLKIREIKHISIAITFVVIVIIDIICLQSVRLENDRSVYHGHDHCRGRERIHVTEDSCANVE